MKVFEIHENHIVVIQSNNEKTVVARHEDENGIYFFNQQLKKEYITDADLNLVCDTTYYNHKPYQRKRKMEITYSNRKEIAKQQTKGFGFSRRTIELYDSCLFWALQNNSKTDTVNVSGKTRRLLLILEQNGFVKTKRNGDYLGAELLTRLELNNKI